MLYSQAEFHQQELLPWYDYHLKRIENGVVNRPKVRFFVQEESIVRGATDWSPLDTTPSTFYLSSDKSGYVNSLNDESLVEIALSAKAARRAGHTPTLDRWLE